MKRLGSAEIRDFGATGAVGKALAPELAREGAPFRAVGRSLERLRLDFETYEPLVEYHAADLNDTKAAAAAAAGVDTLSIWLACPIRNSLSIRN